MLFHMQEKLRFAFEANQRESESAIRFTGVKLNSALNGSETTRKRNSVSLYRGEIKIIYDFFIYHETF